jgi:hypothetical protein
MADLKSVAADPYDMVLADLRTKREELDTAIRTLETLRDGRLGIMPVASPSVEQAQESQDHAGMFLGMSIVDAAKALLKARKRSMSNAEILKDIQAGGVVLTGADPLNVVGSVLTRRFNTVGDVVRVSRGTWGLKEWYPGRSFKPTKATVAADLAVEELVAQHTQGGNLDDEQAQIDRLLS